MSQNPPTAREPSPLIVALCIVGGTVLFLLLNWKPGGDTGPALRSRYDNTGPATASRPAPAPLPPISIAAADLQAEYEANELAADARYKDKQVRVSGAVEKVGKDIIGQPYVSLKGSSFWGVQCIFPRSRESSLAILAKGQIVTIEGKCQGKLGDVLLKESMIR